MSGLQNGRADEMYCTVTGKIAYPNPQRAHRARRALSDAKANKHMRTRRGLHVYRCEHCSDYHLGRTAMED